MKNALRGALRYMLGWAIYFALFFAMWPLFRFAVSLFDLFPAETVIALVAAAIAYVAILFTVLRRFWAWCDKPRADAHI